MSLPDEFTIAGIVSSVPQRLVGAVDIEAYCSGIGGDWELLARGKTNAAGIYSMTPKLATGQGVPWTILIRVILGTKEIGRNTAKRKLGVWPVIDVQLTNTGNGPLQDSFCEGNAGAGILPASEPPIESMMVPTVDRTKHANVSHSLAISGVERQARLVGSTPSLSILPQAESHTKTTEQKATTVTIPVSSEINDPSLSNPKEIPMSDDQNTELFRLAAVRAPEPASGSLPAIYLELPAEGSNPQIDTLVDPDGKLGNFSFYAGPDMAVLSMSGLDHELVLRSGIWSPDDISAWVQNSSGSALSRFISNENWSVYRADVHTALQTTIKPGGLARLGKLRQPAGLVRLTKIIGVLEAITADPPAVSCGQEVSEYLNTVQVILPSGAFPAPLYRLSRPPAIADLKIVRLGPPHYIAAGIAHIENVMATETRERDYRVLEQDETTVTETVNKTTEQEKDLQTTSQVQLLQEASQAVHDTSSIQAGLTISASYGPTVSAVLNTSLSRSQSSDESNHTAATYSNQITQQARQKVVESISVQKVARKLLETEETNKHGFTNTGQNAEHIVGIYRHVDQIQDAWVENYGKRMMLEFMVPEPGAIICWAREGAKLGGTDPGLEPELPKDPDDRTKPLSPLAITAANYAEIVATTGAAGVQAPPPPSVDLAVSFEGDETKNDLFIFHDATSLKVPDGYRAIGWHAQAVMWGKSSGNEHSWMVGVGEDGPPIEEDSVSLAKEINANLAADSGSVLPVLMLARGYINIAASVRVRCGITPSTWQNWQLDVYARAMDAYQQAHQDWLARKARADAIAGAANGQGIADNPDVNRATERGELRRLAIEELLGAPEDSGQLAGQMVVYPADGSRPSLDEQVTTDKRDWILFMEQAFEWENLTWLHYPYYWSNQDRWKDALTRSGQDPIWDAFLSAGATRLIAPVRPGFEGAVSLFLTTGVIWDGGPVPTVGDPTYLGIDEEIKASLGESVASSRVDLDPVRLPTPLIWLQPDSELNPQ